MPNRFDYVKYDEVALTIQDYFKLTCKTLETAIDRELDSPRAKEYAIKALEECYMWVGKAIRDDQIERNGSAPLQEERKDG